MVFFFFATKAKNTSKRFESKYSHSAIYVGQFFDTEAEQK